MKEQLEKLSGSIDQMKSTFSIKQLVMVFIVLFGLGATLVSDWVRFGLNADIFKDPTYWIVLVLAQGSIVVMMLCVYNFMADREETVNAKVKELRNTLYGSRKALTKMELTEVFEQYVYSKNLARKKTAYESKMDRKIYKTRLERCRKAIESKKAYGLSKIAHIHVRFNRIKIATIFSQASLPHANDEDLEDRKSRVTAKMLVYKILGILAFGVLLAALKPEPNAFAWGILYNTFIKLFQAAYAIFCGGTEGIRYVRGPLLSALDNRAQFVQKFIEAQKVSLVASTVPDEQNA